MAKGKPKSKQGGKKGPAGRPVTAQLLYEQAQLALQFDDYDAARTALKKAARMEPSNIEIIDALGALLAEIGPENEALQVLKHAVQLSPDQGYEKYMYLGQLLEGEEAIAYTRKGVALLQQAAEAAAAGAAASTSNSGSAEDDEPAQLRRMLCGALCSLAEMVMNHAESIASVSAEVEQMLAQASAADPSSPEPGQALASLLYEQDKTEAALAALKASMALWYKPGNKDEEDDDDEDDAEEMDADAAGGGDDDNAMEEDSDDEDDEDEDLGPSYEFRVECAKLLLELEDTTETAIDVLETLIEEQDTDPITWHLLGLAYYSGHQYKEAAEVVEKGKALLAKLGLTPQPGSAAAAAAGKKKAAKQQAQQRQGHQGQGGDEDDGADEIVGLFEELSAAVAEAIALAEAGGQAAPVAQR